MDDAPERDKQLIAAFKAGRIEVFNELVDRLAGKLYQVAYGMLGNREDAEEVVQDAMLRAYKALPSFRGDCRLDTWLHRIVANLSRNKYHWNRRRGAEINVSISARNPALDDDQAQEDLNIVDPAPDPDGILLNAELEAEIEKGLKDLPDNIREAMILRHVRELSYEEIAEVMECKVGTVKSRIARGREMLRLILAGIDAGEAKQ